MLLTDTVHPPPACRINKFPAPTCHRCRCSRWENNSSCWFVWKFKAHILDLHNFTTWTAHSAFWTAQNWLDCTVRICPDLHYSMHITPTVSPHVLVTHENVFVHKSGNFLPLSYCKFSRAFMYDYTSNYRNFIHSNHIDGKKLWLHRIANTYLQLIPPNTLTRDVCRSKGNSGKYHGCW